ncbi:MAG: type 4a pilus biogenesis protein PilO, partial [Gammaproteobacteria bacterium]|nr:type 4a pilus biogenesis protein PilO [Gammaproteobacteria bacterium]
MMQYDVNKMYEWPLPAQALIVSLAFFFILYFGYLIDLSSLKRTVKAEALQEETLKEQLKVSIANRVIAIATVAQVPALQDKLNAWQKKITSAHDLETLLDQLLKLGESAQLKFNAFDPDTPVKKGNYMVVPIKISISGTYDQIASYLSEIANMSAMIAIGNFTLFRNDEVKS